MASGAPVSIPNVDIGSAKGIVDDINTMVGSRLKEAKDSAKSMEEAAKSAINGLKDVDLSFAGNGNVPDVPQVDLDFNVEIQLPDIGADTFGTINYRQPSRPSLGSVPSLKDLVIPEFNPSISALTIPATPAWTDVGAAPARPELEAIILPTPPDYQLPALPSMESITVPDFAGLSLPAFDATLPEFEATALPGILQWQEPDYQTEILDEVLDKIRTLWSGGSGIPPAVEQAMFERAASREEQIANRAIDEVADEFSARGFTLPSGMQAARADDLRQELALKKLSLNRELTIKIAEWQIENIRFAVQQGIAAENVLVNIFLNMAGRLFEAAKFQIEAQLNIYNAQVALFNAKMGAFQVQAQVFDTRVKAELTKIEVFKAEVEAEVARGQLNQQKVAIYTAGVQALQATVEIFNARMRGAGVQADVAKSRIEAYRAEVAAYGERISAEKVRFDAYESQVKAEVAKAGIIDAEAKAYAAMVQGKAAGAGIEVKRAELAISTNRVLLEAYVADLEAEKARVQAQLGTIQASAGAFTANTQRFAAEAQAQSSLAQAEIAASEGNTRIGVALYEAEMHGFIAKTEQMIRKAALSLEAMKSAGSIASTMAAGAYAGVHVGASLSGSGGVAYSGNQTVSATTSNNHSYSENYNYEGT